MDLTAEEQQVSPYCYIQHYQPPNRFLRKEESKQGVSSDLGSTMLCLCESG